MNPIPQLTELGQSLWYDNIQRRLLENGQLKAMIECGEIRGVTSNPTIFQKAIASTKDYDLALTPLAWAGWKVEDIFWQLAVEDIQNACDLFSSLYRESKGGDGYVSLEVNPLLAYMTKDTLEDAEALWKRVDRPNLMIKIPATKQGIPAIRQAIEKGININATLIFSLSRYREVADAYLSGLEDRAKEGLPIDQVASVASFFISRIDTKVDSLLQDNPYLHGQAAIASARMAYKTFTEIFNGGRWEALKGKGAKLQRPLWASTSTKNPNYPDTVYVDTLIGANTVNTVPPQTLDAYRDHGKASETVTQNMEKVQEVMSRLNAAGISMEEIGQELEDEGVKSFADAFTSLLETMETRCKGVVSELGSLSLPVRKRIAQFEEDSIPVRLWDGDPSLWTENITGQEEIKKRLGWLHLPETSKALLYEICDFADKIHYEGINRILVLGMGGSSLAPEVLSSVFVDEESEASEGKPCLSILDSTDPAQVAWAAENYPPSESLYVVSSKSGGTAEVNAMLDFFWDLSGGDGMRFIAITDPGTSLEKLAIERGFRKVFLADPNVGGRYSALTVFGLVPAALLGLDVRRLLGRSAWMMAQSTRNTPAARNPCLALGALLGEAAARGRDKLTILADERLASFGSWLEQLIAESSGKDDAGIVPVDREPPAALSAYKKDRLFVYVRQSGEFDERVAALRASGQSVVEISVENPYDLGAEFYRWEYSTAIACHILGVNAFDQPNVEDAKKRARNKIAEYQEKGKVSAGDGVIITDAEEQVKELLSQAKKGDYIAILAYAPRLKKVIPALQNMRVAIASKAKLPTTLGFGPRYLHSTGQLHKGGANNGIFLLITIDPQNDIEIPPREKEPTRKMTFGTLEQAQAMGDYEALKAAGRRALHIHLKTLSELDLLAHLVR